MIPYIEPGDGKSWPQHTSPQQLFCMPAHQKMQTDNHLSPWVSTLNNELNYKTRRAQPQTWSQMQTGTETDADKHRNNTLREIPLYRSPCSPCRAWAASSLVSVEYNSNTLGRARWSMYVSKKWCHWGMRCRNLVRSERQEVLNTQNRIDIQ